MLNIDNAVIARIREDVGGLLADYKKSLNEAFLKAEAALVVSFKSKISPCGVMLEVETSIEFTMEKIKGRTRSTVGGDQGELTFTKLESLPVSCVHGAKLTRDGNCSVLQYCSFICMDRCLNARRIWGTQYERNNN